MSEPTYDENARNPVNPVTEPDLTSAPLMDTGDTRDDDARVIDELVQPSETIAGIPPRDLPITTVEPKSNPRPANQLICTTHTLRPGTGYSVLPEDARRKNLQMRVSFVEDAAPIDTECYFSDLPNKSQTRMTGTVMTVADGWVTLTDYTGPLAFWNPSALYTLTVTLVAVTGGASN